MFDTTFKSLTQRTVGFDTLFDHIDALLSDAAKVQGFPPHNIYHPLLDDNKPDRSKYVIELAVAGFSRDDLSVHLSSQTGVQLLTISGNKDGRDKKDDGDRYYISHGLAARKFTRTFSMAENIRVDSVTLVDGILTIHLSTLESKPNTKLLPIQ